MQWIDVDANGRAPGVAAELPPGTRVLLDAAGNIGAIETPPDPASGEAEQSAPNSDAPAPALTLLGNNETGSTIVIEPTAAPAQQSEPITIEEQSHE